MSSLLSSGTGKSILDKYFHSLGNDIEPAALQHHLFDTVIVDDASLVAEFELIQAALRYGCHRLILLGNNQLVPQVFSINEDSAPIKTLWERALKSLSKVKSVQRIKTLHEKVEPEVVFLPGASDEVRRKKGSYQNPGEARQLLEYYSAEL